MEGIEEEIYDIGALYFFTGTAHINPLRAYKLLGYESMEEYLMSDEQDRMRHVEDARLEHYPVMQSMKGVSDTMPSEVLQYLVVKWELPLAAISQCDFLEPDGGCV